jgi:hypothetical protein
VPAAARWSLQPLQAEAESTCSPKLQRQEPALLVAARKQPAPGQLAHPHLSRLAQLAPQPSKPMQLTAAPTKPKH